MDSQPNVIDKKAAEFVRSRVFRLRATETITAQEIVPRMLSAGLGKEFPAEVRRRRLKTRALQVLRRLHRHGWLEQGSDQAWKPSAHLQNCPAQDLLARRAPKNSVEPTPPPPASWEQFIQDWVFNHRAASFATDDLVVAVVQRGYAAGRPQDGLDEARALVEGELAGLEEECLLDGDGGAGEWHPTELLKSWPDR